MQAVVWVVQALPFAGAAAALYAVNRRFKEPLVNRPYSEAIVPPVCIGNPVHYNMYKNQGKPLARCHAAPVVYAVLNCRGPGIDEAGSEVVKVPLCAQHFTDAEAKHAYWLEDEPRDWQNSMFPMASKTTRLYEHEFIELH